MSKSPVTVTSETTTVTPIKGYKPLNEDQKACMNKFKELEELFLVALKALYHRTDMRDFEPNQRWLKIARNSIEAASMAACRAVADPETVEF